MVRKSKRKSLGPGRYVRVFVGIFIVIIFWNMVSKIATGDLYTAIYSLIAVPFVTMLLYIITEEFLGEMR